MTQVTTTLRCHCGEPAPTDLSGPGGRPVPCPSCGTPLVAPGPVDREQVERGFGAALLTAVGCAAVWMLLARISGSGATFVVVLGGALVGVAARAAARARGGSVQVSALVSFAVFVVLGEVLLYRAALMPRLIALHESEGALDAATRASRELGRLDGFGERFEHYMHIEASLALFVALAVGTAALMFITRAPAAVAAFVHQRRQPHDELLAAETESESASEGEKPAAAEPPAES